MYQTGKRICFLFAFVVIGVSKRLAAQVLLPDGSAKITIEKAGERPRIYVFPGMDSGVVYTAVQTDGTPQPYMDLGCNYSFSTGNGHDDVQLLMRMDPAGTGTFKIPPPGGKEAPPRRLELTVVYGRGAGGPHVQKIVLGGEFEEGVSGSAQIVHYGGAGDFITGHFDATLKDGGEGHTGFYHVSGVFKIPRTE